MKIVVVGNGIASYTFASSILKLMDDCRIEVFSQEAFSPYYRARILSLLKEGAGVEELEIQPEITDRRYSLQAVHVDNIDPENKLVYTSDGKTHEYDVLVLANGAEANRLPLPGGRARGIFALRTYDDVYALRDWLREHRENPVVIGGGLLGLEAACEIARCINGRVTVMESYAWLLPRQLDRDSALYLQHRLEDMGVNVLCPVKTSNFLTHEGCVTAVKCDDGFTVPSDTVVESVGIRSDIFLALDAGLRCDRGVLVDEHLRTSHEDIYAIGDVAQTSSGVAGQLSAAMDMGRTLASVLSGGQTEYKAGAPSSMLKVSGLDVISLGNVFDRDAEAVVRQDETKREAWFVKDSVLTGAVFIGTRENYAKARSMLGKSFSLQ